jgi:hypothetical protein
LLVPREALNFLKFIAQNNGFRHDISFRPNGPSVLTRSSVLPPSLPSPGHLLPQTEAAPGAWCTATPAVHVGYCSPCGPSLGVAPMSFAHTGCVTGLPGSQSTQVRSLSLNSDLHYGRGGEGRGNLRVQSQTWAILHLPLTPILAGKDSCPRPTEMETEAQSPRVTK